MLSIHRPSSALPAGMARPGPDAPPQQVADYYLRMLVADGAVADGAIADPFSPVEPSRHTHGHATGADYFFGRAAPSFASSSPFPEEDLAGLAGAEGLPFVTLSPTQCMPEDTVENNYTDVLHARPARLGGDLLGFPEGGGLSIMMFGPRQGGLCGRSEDDFIEEQFATMHQPEGAVMTGLRVPAAEEESVPVQVQRMCEVQGCRGVASDPDKAEDFTDDADAALTELAAHATEDEELETVLAASRHSTQQGDAALEAALVLSMELIAQADDAALAQALESSTKEADTYTPSPECAEAGVDIPFETPKSLLGDAPAVVACSASSANASLQ